MIGESPHPHDCLADRDLPQSDLVISSVRIEETKPGQF